MIYESLKAARHQVCLLVRQLDPVLFDRKVRETMTVFLAQPGHTLRMLVEESSPGMARRYEWWRHPVIRDLADFHDETGRLQIRAVPRNINDRYAFNFLLLDDYGFSFQANRMSSAAVSSFFPKPQHGEESNDVAHLQKIFSELWMKSVSISANSRDAIPIPA